MYQYFTIFHLKILEHNERLTTYSCWQGLCPPGAAFAHDKRLSKRRTTVLDESKTQNGLRTLASAPSDCVPVIGQGYTDLRFVQSPAVT